MTTMAQVRTAILADACTELAALALAFGRIDRTHCYHPDGGPPESDADHTVMLGWLAPALASRWYPGRLDPGLVAQFALVHDLPEVYAGDTPTLDTDAAGLAAKAGRERDALDRLTVEFAGHLPWLTEVTEWYEAQVLPEARFTRALDKICPKFAHLVDGGRGLLETGMTADELADILVRQGRDIAAYAREFGELMDLFYEMAGRAVTLLASKEADRA